ncbi:alkaline phosphatase synthesis sensor protein PhoR [Clostridium saccharobutylicum]|uniref:HAMP domain-containing sensor histidine kinase n=1 Tax=Clostridium saccharobutylicum TaxID=169679 RepID=UPI000983D64D|nr:HAMP domain-containing sensor histidine kinase [Clostridium saccharobutylicum]AQS10276.1 alkaline phosphatase synthesis sensor protein PhoR [Clostridium saccharobutylicum]MBC2436542.1 HAMP domain-containing histidine kinase [Clostridium saccharobutylicum]NSB87674.1 hypothetical protein [Clostridium saccharobutylicum]NYC31210.1 signal transduction histidine kinase [Clostridium saccharobutylicum]OOM17447.1 alkaline phosphatase synthesis sensor protein PhoR [Clostridium saccharobutylicum]
MEGVKKQKSISKIFAIYIVCFCIVAVLLVVFNFTLFAFGIQTGYILPANYYQQRIEEQRKTIEQAEDVKDLIPQECKYAVYDLNGNMLQGNVSEAKALDMWNIVQSDSRSSGIYFYAVIQRDNGICVVEYMINASFANPILRRNIRNVEIASYIFLFSLFAIEIIIFSKFFKRRLVKEMKILKDTTENIQMENLDFKIEYSNIVEINDILGALDKMKLELKEALAKQWNMEEMRKEQIAALAHDIKTPLTIIKGNSELLDELDLKPDQAEFNNNILNEIKNMESYIKSLIEIMKSEKECVLEKRQINFIKFIDYIVEQGTLISINKQLKFKSEAKDIPKCILVDEESLKRSIINVISNAVDYCPIDGEILFSVNSNDRSIEFIIEDSGRGFTKEELNYATEEFFQGDKSRTSKNHYGMGLYITKKLIEKNNGNIYLDNSEKLGGAKVILKILV